MDMEMFYMKYGFNEKKIFYMKCGSGKMKMIYEMKFKSHGMPDNMLDISDLGWVPCACIGWVRVKVVNGSLTLPTTGGTHTKSTKSVHQWVVQCTYGVYY